MGTGNLRICQEGVSFTTVNDAPFTIIALKAVNCIQSYSMITWERRFSIHTAHITRISG
jgi:hypothetical protein